MARNELQKLKLLLLYEYLWKHSSEEAPLTTRDLLEFVTEQMGENYNRETLIADLRLLNDHGYELAETKVSRQKAYFVPERAFENGELIMLMDAAQAAGFIAPDRTEKLLGKLADLSGPYREQLLQEHQVRFNTRKHSTRSIFSTIEILSRAITDRRKASFRLVSRDENREKQYHNNGQRYVVDPMALVYDRDNYYLMVWHPEDGEATGPIRKFRIDRMEGAAVEDAPVCPEAVLERSALGEYTRRVFSMFGGPRQTVTLEFLDHLTDNIYDRFGEDTAITRTDANHCRTTVEVEVSPTFWGWLFQYAGELRILEPCSLREEYARRLQRALADC